MATTILPSSELVGVAWLLTLPGVTSGMVGTTLPALPADGSGWAATGFYTVTVAGGTAGMDLPIRSTLLQVDCWAAKPSVQRPPWGRADQLAQTVIAGCYGATSEPQPVTVHAGPSTATATIRGVWVASDATRLWGDDASRARVRVDVRIDWTA